MSQAFRVLLFDLGGVLVELDRRPETTGWFRADLSESENWQQWLTSPFTQAFERGEVTPSEFAARFIAENNLGCTIDSFLNQFSSWVVGFYPGVFPLLKQLSERYSVGILSNITEVHWPPLQQELLDHGAVTHYFASYQIGLAKPDTTTYTYAARAMDVDPAQILFIDDNILNVEGARAAGLTAAVAEGFDGVTQILQEYEIIEINQSG